MTNRRSLQVEFNDKHILDLSLKPGTTLEDHMTDCVVAKQLYETLHEERLVMNRVRLFQKEKVPESPYEILPGTSFANTRTIQVEQVPGSINYSRQEVYDVVKTFMHPWHVPRIWLALDKKYPADKFGDSIPLEGVLHTLLNENEQYLIED